MSDADLRQAISDLKDIVENQAHAFEKHTYDDLTNHSEVRATLERIEKKTDAQSTILQPIAEAYSGITFSRKLIINVSTVIVAIGAIGAGIVTLINSVVK